MPTETHPQIWLFYAHQIQFLNYVHEFYWLLPETLIPIKVTFHWLEHYNMTLEITSYTCIIIVPVSGLHTPHSSLCSMLLTVIHCILPDQATAQIYVLVWTCHGLQCYLGCAVILRLSKKANPQEQGCKYLSLDFTLAGSGIHTNNKYVLPPLM